MKISLGVTIWRTAHHLHRELGSSTRVYTHQEGAKKQELKGT